MVERLGGSMVDQRGGCRYGVWPIRIGENSLRIAAGGQRSFPQPDRLHVPRVRDPRQWNDYSDELVQDAGMQLLSMLGISSSRLGSPTPDGASALGQLVERTRWKFAWTYARTYPHEYTTKAPCNPEDHATLTNSIERDGVIERFGDSRRKYLYFEGRKYWHMGEPRSEDPERWPNVVNRTWVDVKRHAENVKHRWTAEEVGLQMRLWEIQLEKSTDRPRSETTGRTGQASGREARGVATRPST